MLYALGNVTNSLVINDYVSVTFVKHSICVTFTTWHVYGNLTEAKKATYKSL